MCICSICCCQNCKQYVDLINEKQPRDKILEFYLSKLCDYLAGAYINRVAIFQKVNIWYITIHGQCFLCAWNDFVLRHGCL